MIEINADNSSAKYVSENGEKTSALTLKAQILKKLRRHNCWGGKHTSIENLQKGIKSDLRGDVPGIAEELIKEKLLLDHPTSYEIQVSLNPKKKAEIDGIVNKGLR
ncbi:MAG: hypothetical protein LUQ59_01185 [Methanothrix sp.]|nr:hypothetical protein [Methanothrix sp.]